VGRRRGAKILSKKKKNERGNGSCRAKTAHANEKTDHGDGQGVGFGRCLWKKKSKKGHRRAAHLEQLPGTRKGEKKRKKRKGGLTFKET